MVSPLPVWSLGCHLVTHPILKDRAQQQKKRGQYAKSDRNGSSSSEHLPCGTGQSVGGVHAPHVVKIAQPERYRITFFDPQQTADDPGLDGMAELWFRDKRHFNTTIGRDAPPEIMDDHFNEYADFSKGAWLSVTEHLNVDGPTTRDTTKLVYFVKRREGVERSALDRYWLDTHVPNVAAALRRTPSARRYTI